MGKTRRVQKSEIEDFEILYRDIPNEVIRERIRSTGEWYIRHAILYKRFFYILSIISIILPLIISSVNVLGEGYETKIRIITTIGERWGLSP